MAEIELITSRGGIKRWLGRATGEARVESTSFEGEERAATDGDAYIFHAQAQTKLAAAGTFFYIKNTLAVRDIIVTRLFIDAISVVTTDLVCSQVLEPATATLGTDLTATNVVQKNTGHQNELKNEVGMFMVADLLGAPATTLGQEYHAFTLPVGAALQRNMHGTNIISPGGTLAFNWTSVLGATAGEVVSFAVNCYLQDTVRE